MDPQKNPIISGLYEVVDQQCNAEQIKALLQRHKSLSEEAKKEIHVSGTKQALIAMLKRVVSKHMIGSEEVYSLVRDSEESGQQHIFIYQLRNRDKLNDLRDSESVANAMIPGDRDRFPSFQRRPDSLQWADFRAGKIGLRPGWLAKLYGHQKVMRLKSRKRTDETIGGFTEILKYQADDYNTVHVLRFINSGLLEIRIDSSGAHNANVIPTRLAEVWDKASGVLSADDFEMFSLVGAMTAMLVNAKANSEIYELGTCGVYDGNNGIIDFKPNDPDESLEGDVGRAKAMRDLLANGAKGRKLVIRWKKHNGAPKDLLDLRTEVGGEDFNEVLVRAKTSAAIIDYVTNQLRAFS